MHSRNRLQSGERGEKEGLRYLVKQQDKMLGNLRDPHLGCCVAISTVQNCSQKERESLLTKANTPEQLQDLFCLVLTQAPFGLISCTVTSGHEALGQNKLSS